MRQITRVYLAYPKGLQQTDAVLSLDE